MKITQLGALKVVFVTHPLGYIGFPARRKNLMEGSCSVVPLCVVSL